MVDFKVQLKAFIEGRVSLAQLQQSLEEELQRSPESAVVYHRAFVGMFRQRLLQEPAYRCLVAVVESVERQDATVVATAPPADDRTQIRPAHVADDQTRVRATLMTPVAAAPTAEDAERTRLGAAPEVAQDEDRTRLGASPEATHRTNQLSNIIETTDTSTGTTGTSQWRKPFAEGQEAAPLGVGSVLNQRFRLVEFIGCGGMGDVYKAEDSRRIDADDADPMVAVKVLNKTFREHPESLRALQRETRKTQNLAHPNIINVFDFDRDQHHVYVTMELMTGRPLNEAIKDQPHGFPLDEALSHVRGMAEALKYAHHLGVIHSDFKPSNIFLNQGVIKVFDFGIARAAKAGQDEHEKQDNFDAGDLGALTPSYASAEMLDCEEWGLDPRDDIYALGCITYELLTGQHPFRQAGKKVPANEACAQGLRPERIKTLNRSQWKALQQALSFQCESRTPSVKDFIDGFVPHAGPQRRLKRWVLWTSATLFMAVPRIFRYGNCGKNRK